ncbi:hypothetical protein ACFY8P_11840 [Streptomyces sp. NPDC012693]|uniref:hypothetical protein n=1 Tax=Streptomyces sp. NPDC012693 TaxID=3364844 RepID=UPI0036B71224
MRSARILFAATATAAALAVTTPGAHALTTGDWGKDDSAHSQKRDHDKPHGGVHTGGGALSLVGADDWSKDHGKDEHGTKDHGKDEHGKKEHGKPHGGVHTGGGALSLVGADDWSKDHGKDEHGTKEYGKPHGGVHTGGGALTAVNADDWSKAGSDTKDHGKDWGKEHEKPKGGMHTGGGGLANSGTNVTGGVLLAGALAAFVLHRRKKAAGANA